MHHSAAPIQDFTEVSEESALKTFESLDHLNFPHMFLKTYSLVFSYDSLNELFQRSKPETPQSSRFIFILLVLIN